MSKSRKCGSKWDLKEEHQYSLENVQDSTWSAKASVSSCERESEHGSFSPEVGRNDNKWSVMKSKHGSPSRESLHGSPSRESLHGSRDHQDNDHINSDYSKNQKTTTPSDVDETHSKKKSPTLDEQRQPNFHHSPKGDWSRPQRSRSRSRSRSPAPGIRRQSGFHERTRNRSGVSTQICKDFMAGRCKRGSQCHFLHQDIQSREDGWDNRQKRAGVSKYITRNDDKDYLIKSGRSSDCCTDYLKGNCRRGASCRFAHDGFSDGFSRGSVNEISREREDNKRNRVTTPERGVEHESRKSSDIPCKYFAAGNCRNGNYCRFSHHGLDMLQDGAKPIDADASFNVENSWNASKGSGADVPNEAEKTWTGPKWSDADASVDMDNTWAGSKWSDTGAYLRATKLNKDTNEKVGASKPRLCDGSMDERWQHDYDVCGKSTESNVHYKRVDIDREKGIPRKIENVGVNMGVSEPKGVEDSNYDKEMSPEWNYQIHSSGNKEKSHSSEPTPVGTYLPANEKNITEKASGQACDALVASQWMSTEKSNYQAEHMTRSRTTAALPCDGNAVRRNSSVLHIDPKFSSNILPTHSFEHPGSSSSSLPHSNLNAIGQSELSIPSNEVNMKVPHDSLLFQEEKPNSKLNIRDKNILHDNYGSLPTSNMVTSFANSGGTVKPDSMPTVRPGQEITFPKQYHPGANNIDPAKKQDANTKPLGFSVHSVSQVNNEDGKQELLANKLLPSSLVGGTNGSDYHDDHSSKIESNFNSHKPNQLQPVASSEMTTENGVLKIKKAEAENKNGLSENMDADDRNEEGKKGKDVKGLRAFKFALVEFVKDLLKPAWKEGQIGKEAYKSIVKKVVDKVTATMQGTNIPQTPEKIDQYLSFSKPKLSKLVQAYVEKFQNY